MFLRSSINTSRMQAAKSPDRATPHRDSPMLDLRSVRRTTCVTLGVLAAAAAQAAAQDNGGTPMVPTGTVAGVKVGGSANMHLVAHVPLGGFFRVADGDIEQELARPYAYIAQTRDQIGFAIID